MEDFEITLFDRLAIIRSTIERYGEDKFYLSFSGGKDSTVLHYLLDEALPNNRIPRIFVNTGIEYVSIVKFVREKASEDPRFMILSSGINIHKMLEEKGYPFKSKEHAHYLAIYQHSGEGKTSKYYLRKNENFTCPKILRYQFSKDFPIKISDRCCYELKKKPLMKWQKENAKAITLTGMRADEGGHRNKTGCAIYDKDGNLAKFHPLKPVSAEFEDWYIQTRKIRLCELYYPPYNFKRTGCKGCPFSLDLKNQLEIMALYFPAERKQCEMIWQPVYEEYRRLGYRLKKDEPVRLF